MNDSYQDLARFLKALSDPKRLAIVDMLSCGERCACDLLDYFSVTQPTLSHDMKVLLACGICTSRKSGKNTYYALCGDTLEKFEGVLHHILSPKKDCICFLQKKGKCACES